MVQHFLGFYLTIWNWGSRHPMSTVSISKHLTCCKILCTSTFWMKSSLVAEIGAQLGFSDSWFWSNFHPSKKQPSKNSAFRCFSIFDLFLGPIRAGLPTVCQIHTSIHESWVGRDQQRLALSLACHGIKQTSSNISLEQSLGMGKSSIFRHISSFFWSLMSLIFSIFQPSRCEVGESLQSFCGHHPFREFGGHAAALWGRFSPPGRREMAGDNWLVIL